MNQSGFPCRLKKIDRQFGTLVRFVSDYFQIAFPESFSNSFSKMPFQRKSQADLEAMNAGLLALYKVQLEDVFKVLRDRVYANGGLDQISAADHVDWLALVEEISVVQQRLIQAVLGIIAQVQVVAH